MSRECDGVRDLGTALLANFEEVAFRHPAEMIQGRDLYFLTPCPVHECKEQVEKGDCEAGPVVLPLLPMP